MSRLTVDTAAGGSRVDEPLAGGVNGREFGPNQGPLYSVTHVSHHRGVARH